MFAHEGPEIHDAGEPLNNEVAGVHRVAPADSASAEITMACPTVESGSANEVVDPTTEDFRGAVATPSISASTNVALITSPNGSPAPVELFKKLAAAYKDLLPAEQNLRDRGLKFGQYAHELSVLYKKQGARKGGGLRAKLGELKIDQNKFRYWHDQFHVNFGANCKSPRKPAKRSDVSAPRYVSLQVPVADREAERALVAEWSDLSSEDQREVIRLGLEALRSKKLQEGVQDAAAA